MQVLSMTSRGLLLPSKGILTLNSLHRQIQGNSLWWVKTLGQFKCSLSFSFIKRCAQTLCSFKPQNLYRQTADYPKARKFLNRSFPHHLALGLDDRMNHVAYKTNLKSADTILRPVPTDAHLNVLLAFPMRIQWAVSCSRILEGFLSQMFKRNCLNKHSVQSEIYTVTLYYTTHE